MMSSILLILGSFFGGGTAILILSLWLYMNHPDNFKKIVGHIAFIISYLFKKYEYIAIKNETEGKINGFVASLEGKIDVELPYVSIKWASPENGAESIIYEDFQTIIVMRDKRHRNRNFVHAAYFFMSEIFLKDSKRHLSKNLKTALDLFATREILKQESAAAVEQFFSDYISPEVERSDAIREYLKKFHTIERFGVFFPILIQELSLLGKKVFLEKKSPEVIEEIKKLIGFLEGWANRKAKEEIPEIFVGNYTRCAIKIVASKYSREKYAVDNQKSRILKAIKLGCENVYAIGRIDDENKQFMDDVASKVIDEQKGLEIKKKLSYRARIKNADGETMIVPDYFIHIHNPKAVQHLIE